MKDIESLRQDASGETLADRRDGPPGGPPGGALVPLYFQVFAALKDRIRQGAWPPPQPLPTEIDLAEQYGVSRVTIRKAMALLEEQSLIWRQRGRGTFVGEHVLGRSGESNFAGLVENSLDFQRCTTVRIIRFTTVPAAATVADRLAIPIGADVLEIVRVRRHDTGPFSHVSCFVTYPEALRLDQDALGNRPVLTALEAVGVKTDRAEQGLSAQPADPVVAEHLQVPAGTPLIAMWRIVRDRSGRPVEYVRSLYRADRYEYRVTLSKHAGPSPPRWVAVD